jgi:Cu+-exporting ATPase
MMPMMMGGKMCHRSHEGHASHAMDTTLTGQAAETSGAVKKSGVKETYYTCPMHSQVHETKAGNCPLCGMDLMLEKSH